MREIDVAFSLLNSDEPTARKVEEQLPSGTSSFLYSTAEREAIAAGDLLDFFPSVFRQARLCVVLYRAEWGETRWTRLEKTVIVDRYLDEGSGCLLLVRLDGSTLPAWFPQTDCWVDHRSRSPQDVANAIMDRLKGVQAGLARRTSRSADLRPVPIARYQRQLRKIAVQSLADRPQVCDGCTALVEFKPYVRVILPPEGGWGGSEEGFCPACARDRGVAVSVPPGMEPETLYGTGNPTFREHVIRLMRQRVLDILNHDAGLRTFGVQNIGASIGQGLLHLIVSGAPGELVEIQVPIAQFEREGVSSEAAITDRCRALLVEHLQTQRNRRHRPEERA